MEYFLNLIFSVACGVVGAFIWSRFVTNNRIMKLESLLESYRILLGGIIKDGSALYTFQNVHAKRIQDIEQHLGMESISPEQYKEIQEKVFSKVTERIRD